LIEQTAGVPQPGAPRTPARHNALRGDGLNDIEVAAMQNKQCPVACGVRLLLTWRRRLEASKDWLSAVAF
jgi:hypothetical protein